MTSLAAPLELLPYDFPNMANGLPSTNAAAGTTIDAANEYVDFIGDVYWDGEASSKVVSSSGGAIVWRTGTVTFAQAGTTLEIGIQDLDLATGPPGRGDGTFDVSAQLVGGTDTIATDTTYETPMESGSKTITFGQRIVIRITLTARAAVDSVSIRKLNAIYNGTMAQVTSNTSGSAATVSSSRSLALIKADDGTYGWFVGTMFCETFTERIFDSGTGTADEYGSLVQFPFEVSVCGICCMGLIYGDGGSLKAILYSDPLGTPVAERENTVDTDTHAGNYGTFQFLFTTPYTVPANTLIFCGIQPQDTNGDIGVVEASVGSNGGALKPTRTLGGTWSKGTRLNNSGAVSQTTTAVMFVGPIINGIAVGSGGLIGTPSKRAGMQ